MPFLHLIEYTTSMNISQIKLIVIFEFELLFKNNLTVFNFFLTT